MATTITKLYPTGDLHSSVEFNEITYTSIKIGPAGVYAAEFDEISLPDGTAERRTSTGTYWVSGIFDEYTLSIVTSGLVLHLDASNAASYPGSGTTWTDLSGNSNTGSLTNGPAYNSANDGIIFFDSIDDFANVTVNAQLNNIYATNEVWVKPITATTATNGQIISRTNTSAGTFNIFQGSTVALPTPNVYYGNLRISTDVQYVINANSAVTTDWVQVVTTYDGSTFNMYINGVKQTSEAAIVSTINTGGTLTQNIGRNTTAAAYFGGNIAIVRIYNRALTAEEVSKNFDANRGRFGI